MITGNRDMIFKEFDTIWRHSLYRRDKDKQQVFIRVKLLILYCTPNFRQLCVAPRALRGFSRKPDPSIFRNCEPHRKPQALA